MSITIQGVDQLHKELNQLDFFKVMRPPMQRSVLRIEAFMKDYPAPPPRSRYVRKGAGGLGGRWTTHVDRTGNQLTGKVGNNIEYGPYVQSQRFQTRLHRRTGWRTDEQAVRELEPAIIQDFTRSVQQALGAI